MKFVSWNVNGIRACLTKGFEDRFRELDADIFCLQETKCQQGQVEIELPGYHQYWNYANRKGYSGTAIFTKQEPLSVFYGIGIEEHDKEGRVITLEFDHFYFVDGTEASFLSNGVGERFSRISSEAPGQKAGHLLRRSECRASGDRS